MGTSTTSRSAAIENPTRRVLIQARSLPSTSMPSPQPTSFLERLISDDDPFGPSPEGAPATEPAAPESPGAAPDSDPADAESAMEDGPPALFMTDPGWEEYGVLLLRPSPYREILDRALRYSTTYRVPLPAVVEPGGLPTLTNSLGEPLMWIPARDLRAAAREVGWYPTVEIFPGFAFGSLSLYRLRSTFRLILFLPGMVAPPSISIIGGMSVREVARAMGITCGSARRAIARLEAGSNSSPPVTPETLGISASSSEP